MTGSSGSFAVGRLLSGTTAPVKCTNVEHTRTQAPAVLGTRAIGTRALVWSSVHRGYNWGRRREVGGGGVEWGQDERKRERETVGARSGAPAACPAQRGA